MRSEKQPQRADFEHAEQCTYVERNRPAGRVSSAIEGNRGMVHLLCGSWASASLAGAPREEEATISKQRSFQIIIAATAADRSGVIGVRRYVMKRRTKLVVALHCALGRSRLGEWIEGRETKAIGIGRAKRTGVSTTATLARP
jgi:hypothetical protein